MLISFLENSQYVQFENVYLYSKSLQQAKYKYLENLLALIYEIRYFTVSNNYDVIPPSKLLSKSIFVIDDVAYCKQDRVREYFTIG